jgi:hypothetical protein
MTERAWDKRRSRADEASRRLRATELTPFTDRSQIGLDNLTFVPVTAVLENVLRFSKWHSECSSESSAFRLRLKLCLLNKRYSVHACKPWSVSFQAQFSSVVPGKYLEAILN